MNYLTLRIFFVEKRIVLILLVLILFSTGNNALSQHGTPSLPSNKKDIDPSSLMVKKIVQEYASEQIKNATSLSSVNRGLSVTQILKDSMAFKKLKQSLVKQLKAGDSTLLENLLAGGGTISNSVQQQVEERLKFLIDQVALNEFTKIVKPSIGYDFLQLKSATVAVSGQTTPSLFDAGRSFYLNSVSLEAQLSILGLPIGGRIMRQDYFEDQHRQQFVFNWQFDRDDYLKSMKEKVKSKLRPEELLSSAGALAQSAKEKAEGFLKNELEKVNKQYSGLLGDKIAALGDFDKLLHSDVRQLKQMLITTDFLRQKAENTMLLQDLMTRKNAGEVIEQALLDSLEKTSESYTGTLALLEKIKNQKEEWEKNGFLDALKNLDVEKNQSIEEWMNNPDKLKTLIKDQFSLSGVQKLVLNINKLSIGQNTISLSPLSIYGFLNKGINAGFFNNNQYLFLMVGKEKDFSNLNDYRFINNIFSNDHKAYGVRIGKGMLNKNHTHFSFFQYKQEKSTYGTTSVQQLPAKSTVATISNRVTLAGLHYITTEVSKSSRVYSNEHVLIDSLASLYGANDGKLWSTDNIKNQLALSCEYEGTIEKWAMTQQLYVSYFGSDYYNPGSLFLSRGMKEIGGRLKKYFWKRTLQISVRANYRQYSYHDISNQWRNLNLSFQSRLKLKHGQYLAVSYQPYKSLRFQDNRQFRTGGSDRFSIEGNLRPKWGKLNYTNTLSLVLQQNDYRFNNLQAGNRSLQVSSAQQISIGRQMLFSNIAYTKVNQPSDIVLFNSSFTADGGLSYTIGKGLQASTALNYNDVRGWYQQVGVKQSLSGQLGKRISLNLYLDISKNIKEYRPNNMDRLRADWSIVYAIF